MHSIEDLMNLRNKCGNGHQLISEILFENLTIIYCDDFHDLWKILTQTECTCKLSKLVRSFNLIDNNCKFIRKLELIGDLSPIFESTNFFEQFECLELLEIFDKNEFRPIESKSYTLKLKKLNKLVMHFYCDPKRINLITLDTPNLNWLCLNYDPRIKLKILYPHTIITLEIEEYFDKFKLPNLNYIWFTTFFNYKGGLLINFPNLVDFHFLDSDPTSIGKLQNELKTKDNQNLLRIFQNNIQINDIRLLTDSYTVILDFNLLNFYKKHQSRLVNRFHFIKDIQLTFDLKEIPNKIFSCLTCLSHIKVSHKIDNLDLWILLLKSCIKLGSIRFKTRIDQKYIDLLPKFVPQINRLIIDYSIQNLQFIDKLQELTYLSIEQELPFDYFKRQCIKSHNFIKIIQFYFNEKQYTIEFLDNQIYFGNSIQCEILIKSLDELIDEFKINKYRSWNCILSEMKNFRFIDYKNLNNLAYLIDMQPEIKFSKLDQK